MYFEAVKTNRLYQQIADQIATLITGGRLAPGERLPPEHELTGKLNVSRPTVREALIALETAGLIEVRNGSGAYVRARLPATVVFPWSPAGEGVPGPFEQFQAREIIEPGVAMLAATHATAEELDALDALIERMEETYPKGLGDEEGYAFHTLLARSTRNAYLENLVRDLWTLRQGEMWATLRGRLLRAESRQDAIAIRRKMVAALRAHDGPAASALMSEMLSHARGLYFEGLDAPESVER